MSAPINPAPVKNYRPEYLPAYLSNGTLGLRISRIPLLDGLAMVSGYAGRHPSDRVEAFAPAPVPTAGDIRIGELWLSRVPQNAEFVEQAYDFSCGELKSRFLFTVEDATADVEVLTFCSRTLPTLALQEVRFKVNRACDVVLRGGIDPRGVAGGWLSRETTVPRDEGNGRSAVDGSLHWESHGRLSTIGEAYITELLGSDDAVCRRQEMDELAPLWTDYSFRARAGKTYRLRQIVSLVPSALHHAPDAQATRLVHFGARTGFDALREANRRAWDDIWRGRIMLVGAEERWQALADAAYFYLSSSTHPSSLGSTGLFGLAFWSDYHYYHGHLMWDIETFGIPPLILSNPHAAESLLQCRFERLPAAQANAAMWGYRGLQFPWESSPIRGEEAAPGVAATAGDEVHVSMDIALAFSQYAHASGDPWFLAERAWPVLHGVAEWITSRAEVTDRGYEIRQVCGIAEKEPPVDNNAFVNMSAMMVLREVIAAADRLGYAVRSEWRAIADRLVLPLDSRTGVIRNHDSYRANEEKGETPEAPAGLWPVGYAVSPEVERATFDFYLRLADKYVGAPMLSALLGVYAARLGDRRRSLELFERGYADLVIDPFSMTDEYSRSVFPEQPRAAPMFANIGGFLTALLYGLPGIRIGPGEPSSWCERAVCLPDGWECIEVERIWARGRPARLVAKHGAERARIEVECAD